MAIAKQKNIFLDNIPKTLLISYCILSFLFILKTVYIDIQQRIYNVGMQNGYKTAIVEVINKSKNCSVVPFTANNTTIRLADISCFEKTEIAE